MFFHSILQTVSLNKKISNREYDNYQDFCDAYWEAMRDPNIILITINPE